MSIPPTAANGPQELWPFLAVLVRPPGETTAEEEEGTAIAVGLGWLVTPELVVTAGRVANVAEEVVFANELAVGRRRRMHIVGGDEDGKVAVVRLEEALEPDRVGPRIRPPVVGEVCTVATVDNRWPSGLLVRPGRITAMQSEDSFTVELDVMPSDSLTAAVGSPVLAEGSIVGVVSPRVMNHSVMAFTLGAVQPLLGEAPEHLAAGRFSASAEQALAGAALSVSAAMTRGDGTPPEVGTLRAAVLLATLDRGARVTSPTVARAFLDAIVRAQSGPIKPGDLLVRAAPSVGVLLPVTEAPLGDAERRARELLQPVVDEAAAVAARLGADAVHARHLLAAAVADRPPGLPSEFLQALGMSAKELRTALRTAIARAAPDDPAQSWDELLTSGLPAVDLAGGFSSDAVDPTRGIPLDHDHLGVRDYVAMFATLIADEHTPLPLSIGLFGEWGSGKSYFMGLLREQVDELRHSAGVHYLRNIVQIGFNAWHYADTNLWASLGDEIWEQLLGPGQSADQQRQQLRKELEKELPRRKELEDAAQAAREETERISSEIARARVARQSSAVELVRAALRTRAVQAKLQDAWRRLGVKDDQIEQARLLGDALGDTRVEYDAVRQATGGRGKVFIAVAIAMTVALIVAGYAVSSNAAGALAGAAVAFSTVVSAALAVTARARSGLALLRQVATELGASMDQPTTEAVARLRQAEADERALLVQRDNSIGRVADLQRQLTQLSPERRLYTFIEDRAREDTYRRHLGLISTVRKDFEQLVELLNDWDTQEDRAKTGKPIDRIVLYIDDLDRCSARQVVQVLQAVHLLLALELFVVVIGVDPRWLLRSLQDEYPHLLLVGSDTATWQATPEDYLEKILNVPFALPHMSPASFRTLLHSFADEARANQLKRGSEKRTAVAAGDRALTAARERSDGEQADKAIESRSGDVDLVPVSQQEEPLRAEAESEIAAARRGSAEPEARPLGDDELGLLAQLAPLVATPREAKRLMNLYRMIRSTRNLSGGSRFLGDEHTAGEYQAVVVLLGLLSGHGRLLASVLDALPDPRHRVPGGLRHRPAHTTWTQFIKGIAPRRSRNAWRNEIVGRMTDQEAADWNALARGLQPSAALVTLPDLQAFHLWAPRIARFSFLLSPCAAERPDGDGAEQLAATVGGSSTEKVAAAPGR